MPLQETSGAASYDAFGGGAAAITNYIEDVFSTYLYTGNGSTQTITNGIDLSTKGGLVWLKGRSTAGQLPGFFDTQRGVSNFIWSNSTANQSTFSGFGVTAFSTSGFTTVDDSGGGYWVNGSGITYASWTFRKQAKFFDVVTYTGDGVAGGKTINHALNSTPGAIITKSLGSTGFWWTGHRSLPASSVMALDDTFAAYNSGSGPRNFTSTSFTVVGNSNLNGATYVAYLFAHDAGGFGLSGTDNVISCGSFTTNSSKVITTGDVNLGFEPQWLLLKRTDTAGSWILVDNMRGWGAGRTNSSFLFANSSLGEDAGGDAMNFTSTGLRSNGGWPSADATFIYIAIRRGPMKVPTSGTQVYQPLTNQPLSGGLWNHNILTDFSFYHWQNGTQNWGVQDRLRGSPDLSFNSTAAENGLIGGNSWDVMNGYKNSNPGAGAYNSWAFRRAPGFMDVVCYTGTGVARTVTHNLGVVPELIIVKGRSQTGTYWVVRHPSLTAGNVLILNLDYASTENSTVFTTTAPTASVFSVGTNDSSNASGQTLVAYLFATVAGVSKVGSYTGTGTTQVINCGFTAGSRFVMIKRTDSTGDWYVWDSARGIVAGNDPYVLLNSGATNVTGTDYIDTAATGFEISSTAPAAINANGGSFIFLAIA